VPAGGGIDYWAKLVLPEEDDPEHLSAVLRHGILFGRLEVP